MSNQISVLPGIARKQHRLQAVTRALKAGRMMLVSSLFMCSMTHAADPIAIAEDIPYKNPEEIQGNIIQECTELGSKLSQFIEIYADKQGLRVVRTGSLDVESGKPSAVIHITKAVSMGNAFIGHQKYMAAKVEYWNEGKLVTLRHFERPSMGGFGAGFKGSCSVLGRITKALGKDIGIYLSTVRKS